MSDDQVKPAKKDEPKPAPAQAAKGALPALDEKMISFAAIVNL